MHLFYERLQLLHPGLIAVTEIPFDAHSSFLQGAAAAPAKILEAFRCGSANTYAEDGTELGGHPGILELGPVPFEDYPDIGHHVDRVLEKGGRLLSLGGDHSITFPLLEAHAKYYPDLTILQIDAHADLYDEFEGNRYSHACPFARIMEKGLARRLVQVGVRTLTTHQRTQAARFGVELWEMRHGFPAQVDIKGPLYLSLDMDVLDPAAAPGVSHHEPGGPSVREVLRLIQHLEGPIVGADIVELNPTRDIHNMTAMVAAKFYREILAKMLERDQ